MKKLLAFVLTTILLTSVFVSAIYAANNADSIYSENKTTSYTEYYEDGSYTVTTITQSPKARSSSYTLVGSRIVDLYNNKDELQWRYTLHGTFYVVEGVSATCTESTYSSEIFDNAWSLTAHSNDYSNNIAHGTATYKKKVLFITTNTHDVNVEVG